MSKCIECGKYIERTYAPSECLGMYCQDCAKSFYVNDDKDRQINQLKQQLKEIKDECDLYKKFADGGAIDLVIESVGRLREIEKLKQQLEESFTEEDVEGLIEDRDKTIKFLQKELAEKDTRITELEDKDWYEACIKQLEEQNNRLIDTLKEKDKEIERLKFFERIYYQNQLQASQEDIQQFQQLANQSAVNINHIAITELEKVKTLIQNAINFEKPNFVEVYDAINKQIKELKGEKDAEG